MANSSFITDIFTSEEAQSILKNKYILFIGDSVIRGMYKDLVKFLQTDQHLLDNQLKNKGEMVFENDQLVEGGQKGEMSNEITYSEIRVFKRPFHYIKFYFITRCYSDYVKTICDDIAEQDIKPDVLIMNSGCWDLTRYGENSMFEYKQNLPLGLYHLCRVLPAYTLFIWTTILPLSRDVKGGFMAPEVEYTKSKLREDVLEANSYARTVIDHFKLELIDLHYYFLKQTHRRAKDGIHWDPTSHRRITNIFLNHICYAWKKDTPGRLTIKNNPDIFIQDNQEDIDEYSDFNMTLDNNPNSFSNPIAESNYSDSGLQLPSDLSERIGQIHQPILDSHENNENANMQPEQDNNSNYQFYQQNQAFSTYLNNLNNKPQTSNMIQSVQPVDYQQLLMQFNSNPNMLRQFQQNYQHLLAQFNSNPNIFSQFQQNFQNNPNLFWKK